MLGKACRSVAVATCLVAVTVACKPATVLDAPTFDGQVTSAADVVTYAKRGDFTATAVLQSATRDIRSDNMDGSLFWTVTQCHAGECAVGSRMETRYRALFSLSGKFCRVPNQCTTRAALADYVGESFLVGFYRDAYVQQVDGVGGEPLPQVSSLNGGFYLINGGHLYNNDPHWQVDAGYQEVLQLISENKGMSHDK